MKHRCPRCEEHIGKQTLDGLIQLCEDLLRQDTLRIAVTGECGRSIVLAHLLNIINLSEALSSDPAADSWTMEELMVEAKKMQPMIRFQADRQMRGKSN